MGSGFERKPWCPKKYTEIRKMDIHAVLKKHFGMIAVSGDRRTEIANVLFSNLGILVNAGKEVSAEREKVLIDIILESVMSVENFSPQNRSLQLSKDAVSIATLVNTWE